MPFVRFYCRSHSFWSSLYHWFISLLRSKYAPIWRCLSPGNLLFSKCSSYATSSLRSRFYLTCYCYFYVLSYPLIELTFISYFMNVFWFWKALKSWITIFMIIYLKIIISIQPIHFASHKHYFLLYQTIHPADLKSQSSHQYQWSAVSCTNINYDT